MDAVLVGGRNGVEVAMAYYYPKKKKNEIEKMVKGCGAAEHESLFRSCVIGKKHDGLWQLCVDYRHSVTLQSKIGSRCWLEQDKDGLCF